MITTTTAGTAPVLDDELLDDVARQWMDAWNARDGVALGRLCTDDVQLFDPAIGTVFGRPAIADWVAAAARAFPDCRLEEPERPYLSRDLPKAIVPWRMVGTFTGPLDPPGFLPTGRSFDIDGVDHWWLRGDLVQRVRVDYDLTGLSRQLGLVPEPGARAERLMVRLQRIQQRARR